MIARWRAWTNPARERRVLAGLTVGMVIVYIVGILLTSGPRGSLVQGDARSYFAYLPSLVLDRDLDLRNQFVVLQPEGDSAYPFGVGYEGRAQNPFPIAPALIWLPGYVAGLGLDAIVGGTPADGQPLGFGAGAVLGTAAWSILLVGVGAEATRRLVRQSVGTTEALPATVMAWLATPALYYSMITPLYSHAPAWFAVSLMLWLTWRAAEQPGRIGLWVASGLAAGWVMAIRFQDTPLLIIPATLLLVSLYRTPSSGGALRLSLAWIGALAAGYLAQGLTWYWLHGTWVPYGGVSWTAPRPSAVLEILFSVGYQGWISWTPIVLPGLAGLALLAARTDRVVTRWLALSGIAGALGILLIDLLHPFGAGAAFGGRRYVSVTPILALGLAALLGDIAAPRVRKAAWILLPSLTIWNLCVLLSYELLVIRHGIYPTLLQVVRHIAGLEIS